MQPASLTSAEALSSNTRPQKPLLQRLFDLLEDEKDSGDEFKRLIQPMKSDERENRAQLIYLLKMAYEKQHLKIFTVLIEHLVYQGEKPPYLQFIMDICGIDPDNDDLNQEILLNIAATEGRVDYVQVLLNAFDKYQKLSPNTSKLKLTFLVTNAVCHALHADQWSVVNYLFKHWSVDPDLIDPVGKMMSTVGLLQVKKITKVEEAKNGDEAEKAKKELVVQDLERMIKILRPSDTDLFPELKSKDGVLLEEKRVGLDQKDHNATEKKPQKNNAAQIKKFFSAISAGNLQEIEGMVANNSDILKTMDDDGNTVLHAAISYGFKKFTGSVLNIDLTILEYFLKKIPLLQYHELMGLINVLGCTPEQLVEMLCESNGAVTAKFRDCFAQKENPELYESSDAVLPGSSNHSGVSNLSSGHSGAPFSLSRPISSAESNETKLLKKFFSEIQDENIESVKKMINENPGIDFLKATDPANGNTVLHAAVATINVALELNTPENLLVYFLNQPQLDIILFRTKNNAELNLDQYIAKKHGQPSGDNLAAKIKHLCDQAIQKISQRIISNSNVLDGASLSNSSPVSVHSSALPRFTQPASRGLPQVFSNPNAAPLPRFRLSSQRQPELEDNGNSVVQGNVLRR